MKYNYLRKLILLVFPLFLYSCGSIKDGFTNQKKASSDEFLVEKKAPLVMPPDYDQLPIPNLDDNNYVSEDGKIKKLLKKSNINAESEASENSSNLEDSLIDKIKNN